MDISKIKDHFLIKNTYNRKKGSDRFTIWIEIVKCQGKGCKTDQEIE